MTTGAYRDDHGRIVVLNPKGGCGKTTLATNLASYFALRGPAPTLIDTDPNGYVTQWLQRRPSTSRPIRGVRCGPGEIRERRGWWQPTHRSDGIDIVDTPAGLSQRQLSRLAYDADCILIPVLPSEFDVEVTTRFVANLMLATDLDRPIAVVANRTRRNTKSLARLLGVLTSIETPTIAVLRNSQNYVRAADEGIGICELPGHMAKDDLEGMIRIVEWLDQRLSRSLQPSLAARFNPLHRLFGSDSDSATPLK